jgi:hypothetical protein
MNSYRKSAANSSKLPSLGLEEFNELENNVLLRDVAIPLINWNNLTSNIPNTARAISNVKTKSLPQINPSLTTRIKMDISNSTIADKLKLLKKSWKSNSKDQAEEEQKISHTNPRNNTASSAIIQQITANMQRKAVNSKSKTLPAINRTKSIRNKNDPNTKALMQLEKLYSQRSRSSSLCSSASSRSNNTINNAADTELEADFKSSNLSSIDHTSELAQEILSSYRSWQNTLLHHGKAIFTGKCADLSVPIHKERAEKFAQNILEQSRERKLVLSECGLGNQAMETLCKYLQWIIRQNKALKNRASTVNCSLREKLHFINQIELDKIDLSYNSFSDESIAVFASLFTQKSAKFLSPTLSLILQSIELSSIGFASLFNALSATNLSVNSIDLSNYHSNSSVTHIASAGSFALSRYLASPLCQLSHLSLCNLNLNGAECLSNLANGIKSNQGLQTLEIASNQLKFADLQCFAAALSAKNSKKQHDKPPKLVTLVLKQNKFGSLGCIPLASIIASLPQLTKLDISACSIGLPGFSLLSNSLSAHSTLNFINFSDNFLNFAHSTQEIHSSDYLFLELTNNSLVNRTVSRKFAQNYSLSTLNFANCALENKFLHELCEVLAEKATKKAANGVNQQSVTALNLSNNQLTDDAAHILANFIRKSQDSLQKLDLSRNLIGDKGVIGLFEALRAQKSSKPGLKELLLQENSFSTSAGEVLLAFLSEKQCNLEKVSVENNKLDYSVYSAIEKRQSSAQNSAVTANKLREKQELQELLADEYRLVQCNQEIARLGPKLLELQQKLDDIQVFKLAFERGGEAELNLLYSELENLAAQNQLSVESEAEKAEHNHRLRELEAQHSSLQQSLESEKFAIRLAKRSVATERSNLVLAQKSALIGMGELERLELQLKAAEKKWENSHAEYKLEIQGLEELVSTLHRMSERRSTK